MRSFLFAALLTLSGAVASAAGALPYESSLSFVAYRNGEPIGRHTVTFERDGGQLKVSTSIELAVKFMGFTAYRYSHRAQEVWAGDSLVSLTSTTDDNGTKHNVTATRRAGDITVAHDGKQTVLPAKTLPSSHWNIEQVRQSMLLNTQKGTEAKVAITQGARENVKILSGFVPATRYSYTGDVVMDQWFDDRGRWVKTSFKASDGSTIEYVLQE
ncbi:MAG: DUF6134 family protein [Acidimicrobiia bacterium]